MKRSLMLFVVLGWAFMAPVSAQWHSVPKPPDVPSGREMWTIWFQDSLTGYAGGDESAFVKTTDGGRSWFSMPPIPGPHWAVTSIYFRPDGQEGWIAGQPIYTAGTIMHTTDAGQTWTEQFVPVQDTLSDLFDIAEVGNEIWIVGMQARGSSTDGLLLRSTNRGQTWLRTVFPGYWFFSVQRHGGEVWITGKPGVILKTSDAGVSWDTVFTAGIDVNLRGIYFGETEWYTAGSGLSDMAGVFYASTDQGQTWQLRKTWALDEMGIGARVLVSNNTIYCSGLEALVEGRARIYASTDRGFTWERIVDEEPYSAMKASFQLDDRHMWVTGHSLWYYQHNSTPVVSEVPNDTAYVGAQWTYQVQATDAEGDTLKYKLLARPAWLAIDSLSGIMSGTPSLADTGTSQVTVSVADGVFGNEVAASFFLAVADTSTPPVNMAPYFVTHMPDTVDVRPDSSYLWYFIVADPNPRDTLESESGPIGAPGFFVLPNSQPAIDTLMVTVDGKPFASDTGQVFLAHVVAYDQGGLTDTLWFYIRVSNATSVRELPGLPTEYRLDQNYPNPFNPTTVIRYEIPYSATVRLTVYNLLGQEIAVLVSERQTPGIYEADFQASNLPSGTYLYRLTAGQYTLTKKMLLLK